MPAALITIDTYKLAVFKKHLNTAGFRYTVQPGPTRDTTNIKVETPSREKLQPIVESAHLECRVTL